MPVDSLRMQEEHDIPKREGDTRGNRDGQGRFLRGRSGNPAGRPPGARNRATMLAEAMIEAEAPALIRTVLDLALDGNATALKLCFERLVAPRRERPARLDLPALASAGDLAAVMGAILAAAGSGQITPGEMQRFAEAVATAMRAIEASDFERRLAELEESRAGA